MGGVLGESGRVLGEFWGGVLGVLGGFWGVGRVEAVLGSWGLGLGRGGGACGYM